ncbi:Protein DETOXIFICATION [Arachis hypogaea]|nr:Protein DETOXIFICATION [Arachis hypogaea]
MEERRKGCSIAAEAPPPLLGLVGGEEHSLKFYLSLDLQTTITFDLELRLPHRLRPRVHREDLYKTHTINLEDPTLLKEKVNLVSLDLGLCICEYWSLIGDFGKLGRGFCVIKSVLGGVETLRACGQVNNPPRVGALGACTPFFQEAPSTRARGVRGRVDALRHIPSYFPESCARIVPVLCLGARAPTLRVMDMDHDYDQVYDEYNSSWGCATEGQSNDFVVFKCRTRGFSLRHAGDFWISEDPLVLHLLSSPFCHRQADVPLPRISKGCLATVVLCRRAVVDWSSLLSCCTVSKMLRHRSSLLRRRSSPLLMNMHGKRGITCSVTESHSDPEGDNEEVLSVCFVLCGLIVYVKVEIYIVTVEGEPVTSYGGGIYGFEATIVEFDEKIDINRQDSDIQKVKLSREALTQLSKLVESRVSTGLDTILTLFYSFWNWGCCQVRLNTIYHKSSVCISRGYGWQHLGPFINLGAFYLCGISLAATFAFWVKLRGRELWIGMTIFSKFKQHPPPLPVTHICQFALGSIFSDLTADEVSRLILILLFGFCLNLIRLEFLGLT